MGTIGRRRIKYRRTGDEGRRTSAEEALVAMETEPDGTIEPADKQRLAAVRAVERVVGGVEFVEPIQTTH